MTDTLDILVLAKDPRSHVQGALESLLPLLNDKAGLNVVAVINDHTVPLQDVVNPKQLQSLDLALVIGGDGSILRACREFGTTQIPILAVNMGRLGFLADLMIDEVSERLDCMVQRNYRVVSHLMYACELHLKSLPNIETVIGLNEVSITSGASTSLFDVELNIDDEQVTTYSGDGLILSTPVGSTAHSLSAGGPILRQDMEAFVITPVCPHTLSVRPIVDRASSRYTMTVHDPPSGVVAAIDGQLRYELQPGDKLVITKADPQFQLVRFDSHSFYSTLHRKLGWDGQPPYPRRDP